MEPTPPHGPESTTVDRTRFEAIPGAKTAFPFVLAVDSRTFGLPLPVLQSELGYRVDAFQWHVPLECGRPVLPPPDAIEEAKQNQKEIALSTVVHLAPDRRLGHPIDEVRAAGIEATIEAVNRLKPLAPAAYVVELVPPDPFSTGTPRCLQDAMTRDGVRAFIDRSSDSLQQVVEATRVAFPTFCLETSTYPIAEIMELANRHLLSFCLDIGTLFRFQYNITEHIQTLLSRTRVFHLHGVSPAGEPHASLDHFPFDHTMGFLGTLVSAHYVGTVCFEVRFPEDLAVSLRIADRAYCQLRGFGEATSGKP